MRVFLKRINAALILLLMSVPAFATSSGTLFTPAAFVNGTDASITYLSQLFGQVGSQLSAIGSQQFIGSLFKIYNEGILVVAGIWILYSMYDILMKISDKNGDQHASGFGVKFTKIGLAILLVIPSATTGYSAAQDLTIFIVRQSVALADSTWNAALDYLQDGNALTEAVEASSSTTTLNTLGKQAGYFGPNFTSTTAAIPVLLNKLICAINTTTWSNISSTSLYTQNNTTFTFKGTGCGSVSPNNLSMTGVTGLSASEFKLNALTDLISSLSTAATLYVCNLNASSIGTNVSLKTYCSNASVSSETSYNAENSFNSQLSQSFLSYVSDLLSVYQSTDTQTSSVASEITKLTDTMKSSGWINTGAYYWAIAGWLQNNGDFGSLSSSGTAGLSQINKVTITAIAASTSYLAKGAIPYSSAIQCKGASNCTTLSTNISSTSSALTNDTSSSTSSTITSPDYTPDDALSQVIYTQLTDLYLQLLSDILDLSKTSPSGDPLIILTVIGFNMISLASTLIAAALAIIVAMAVIAIFGVAVFVLAQALGFIMPILNIIINILKSIAIYLLLIGGILAIYLPLYPWITWVFAVIGWFFAVIEAMAAAPLICIGLTRPAGQELAGEARKALMLLLSVFIRPPLMVIGFCVAIVLSRVLLTFVTHSLAIISLTLFVNNSTDTSSIQAAISNLDASHLGQAYLSSATDLINNLGSVFTGISGDDGLGLFILEIVAIPTIFAIIGYVAYKVISFSFSLVFHLPNYVMTWVGGDTAGSGMMQQLQQAVEQSKGAAEAGLKEGTAVISGGIGAAAALGGMVTDAASSASGKGKKEEG